MNRRNFTASVIAMPLLTGCFWDKHFDVSWEEEVRLHDGRVIVVKLKHTYERMSSGITRYDGLIIPRDTEISFDAGGTTGRVTQLFKGFQPTFLGQHEGVWYVILSGSHYYRSKEIPGQNWGVNWYDCNHVASLKGKHFEPISVHDLPKAFETHNMLLLYGEVSEQAQFNGKRISLQDKSAWLQRHPPGRGDGVICRPPKNAIRPIDIFDATKTQGEKK